MTCHFNLLLLRWHLLRCILFVFPLFYTVHALQVTSFPNLFSRKKFYVSQYKQCNTSLNICKDFSDRNVRTNISSSSNLANKFAACWKDWQRKLPCTACSMVIFMKIHTYLSEYIWKKITFRFQIDSTALLFPHFFLDRMGYKQLNSYPIPSYK